MSDYISLYQSVSLSPS